MRTVTARTRWRVRLLPPVLTVLGLVHVNEALELRADGIEAPLMAWLHTPSTDLRRRCRRRSVWVFPVGTWRR